MMNNPILNVILDKFTILCNILPPPSLELAVLLFLIQINYLHTNLSKNKVYVIVISYEKEFLKNISKLFWYNKICITFTTALLPSSLQKKSNMNKKTFAGGITFALVVSLSIVTSGCSSNIDEPTDARNLC